MRSLILSTALLALTATASVAAPRPGREAVPEATPIGKPVSCLRLQQIRSTKVQSDSVIDFHMRGGKVYRNVLPYSCPSLGFEERFLYRTSINQLCSVDQITVLQSAPLSSGPTCGLGDFQPVVLARR